jgi:hypothetical protein
LAQLVRQLFYFEVLHTTLQMLIPARFKQVGRLTVSFLSPLRVDGHLVRLLGLSNDGELIAIHSRYVVLEGVLSSFFFLFFLFLFAHRRGKRERERQGQHTRFSINVIRRASVAGLPFFFPSFLFFFILSELLPLALTCYYTSTYSFRDV